MARNTLRRDESFLGVHFDYHMREHCTEVGKTVTPEMVERVIELVKPDYIQCDCKGHPGFSSYPTKVGNAAPGFVKDPLRIFRDVTKKHGVALYMHYSGVIDQEAVRQHPEWALVKADGSRDDRVTSVFGPYVDDLLIPQLNELRDVYEVDGVWVDGECWATMPDWSDAAIAAFRKATGIRDIPRTEHDPHYGEYVDFCRQAFRDYLNHYVDAVHGHDSRFQIASNWAFSSQMPEPVSVNVDYISGDYTLQDSVNSARYEGRCMQHQGRPWDLMAWGFSAVFREPDRSTKSVRQLQQEAAVVLALGGGFQAYYKQKPDASIYPWEMTVMGEVAAFCRDRQDFCHKAEPVPQIALLYSGPTTYRMSPRPFITGGSTATREMRGILFALVEAQQVVDVTMEHHLEGRIDDYPLIVVPEWHPLSDEMRTRLADYARRGGSLLVIGSAAAVAFGDLVGVSFGGDAHGRVTRYLKWRDRCAAVRTHLRPVTAGSGIERMGLHYPTNDPDEPGAEAIPAALIGTHGKGTVALVPLDLGDQYLRSHVSLVREFLRDVVNRLIPQPLVSVTTEPRERGAACLDVTLLRKDGSLRVNLVNTSGPHANREVFVYDDYPPVGPLTVTMRVKHPTAVTLEPGAREVPWSYTDGVLTASVPSVEIHDVLVVT